MKTKTNIRPVHLTYSYNWAMFQARVPRTVWRFLEFGRSREVAKLLLSEFRPRFVERLLGVI